MFNFQQVSWPSRPQRERLSLKRIAGRCYFHEITSEYHKETLLWTELSHVFQNLQSKIRKLLIKGKENVT